MGIGLGFGIGPLRIWAPLRRPRASSRRAGVFEARRALHEARTQAAAIRKARKSGD